MPLAVRSQNGFSLVELLIAITIFAVGLLAVSGMQITAIKGNTKAVSVSAASSLALSALEEFMIRPANAALVTTDQASPAIWRDETLSGTGSYRIFYTVETDNPIDNVARISVSVSGGDLQRPVTMVGFKRIIK